MDKKVYALINDQITKEFYSAYLYLDFANYYTEVGLDGFANWFNVQAQEERDHALLFVKYLQNENQPVVYEAIGKPEWTRGDFATPLDKALEHEKYVTSLINGIYAAAVEAKDYRTTQFLTWFINEQAEEEESADDLITKMKLFGGTAGGLYALDNELKERAYSAPSLEL